MVYTLEPRCTHGPTKLKLAAIGEHVIGAPDSHIGKVGAVKRKRAVRIFDKTEVQMMCSINKSIRKLPVRC